MPEFVEVALKENDLLDTYHSRPTYQQNDYIGWINQAVRMETKMKGLNQMLSKLEGGHLYMNMKYI